MASIQLGGGVIDARGSIAGNTFSRARSGATLKARIKGTNPISGSQSRQRVALDQVVKFWQQSMNDADRAAWASFAASNPVLNRFGVTVTQSAFNAFVMLNATALKVGGVITASTPASTAVGQMATASLTLDHSIAAIVQVDFTTTGLGADDVISIWMSPFVSQGKGFISHQLRWIAFEDHDATFDLTSEWTAVFGTISLAAGMKAFARLEVINTVTGIRSAPLQISAIST